MNSNTKVPCGLQQLGEPAIAYFWLRRLSINIVTRVRTNMANFCSFKGGKKNRNSRRVLVNRFRHKRVKIHIYKIDKSGLI